MGVCVCAFFAHMSQENYDPLAKQGAIGIIPLRGRTRTFDMLRTVICDVQKSSINLWFKTDRRVFARCHRWCFRMISRFSMLLFFFLGCCYGRIPSTNVGFAGSEASLDRNMLLLFSSAEMFEHVGTVLPWVVIACHCSLHKLRTRYQAIGRFAMFYSRRACHFLSIQTCILV